MATRKLRGELKKILQESKRDCECVLFEVQEADATMSTEEAAHQRLDLRALGKTPLSWA